MTLKRDLLIIVFRPFSKMVDVVMGLNGPSRFPQMTSVICIKLSPLIGCLLPIYPIWSVCMEIDDPYVNISGLDRRLLISVAVTLQ